MAKEGIRPSNVVHHPILGDERTASPSLIANPKDVVAPLPQVVGTDVILQNLIHLMHNQMI
ncbi:hypothetical protein A2U01_0022310 [Trifolium medium]|uniref:Uncharacterized protein n=1 Tax=Trifolium medium TaxID=97028 RepID=A0A392NS33_9FABA|nr:hypothetical protein [Trifolium medium]